MAEFSISAIFRSAFGYEPPADFAVEAAQDPALYSSLGQPYLLEDLHGREMFLPVRINDYLLPFAVVSIRSKKTIVSTALPERKGTVKELINSEDFMINIKGIIIRPDNNFPESEIMDLHKLYELNESVVMRCALTDIFLKGDFDHRVVMRSLDFPANAGIQHARPFEIEFESDQKFDLVIQ